MRIELTTPGLQVYYLGFAEVACVVEHSGELHKEINLQFFRNE